MGVGEEKTANKTSGSFEPDAACRKTPSWPPVPANSALRPAPLGVAGFGLR